MRAVYVLYTYNSMIYQYIGITYSLNYKVGSGCLLEVGCQENSNGGYFAFFVTHGT